MLWNGKLICIRTFCRPPYILSDSFFYSDGGVLTYQFSIIDASHLFLIEEKIAAVYFLFGALSETECKLKNLLRTH